MTLGEKQALFSVLIADLIQYARATGYQIKLGEAWRSGFEAARLAKTGAGIRRSLHCDRIAIDLLLFKDGQWLKSSDSYRFLGEYWELQSTDQYECCWGGRFKDANGKPKPDGGHFSIGHGGRK